MKLCRIEVSNFRNIHRSSIQFSQSLSIFVGGNGAGKTSLLEASFLLGRGSSFKSNEKNRVIRTGAQEFVVAGFFSESSVHTVQVSHGASGKRVLVNGDNVPRLSALAREVVFRLFYQESVELVAGGPDVRRSFLDWLLFHVEHSYLDLASEFERARSQLSAVLRSGDRRGLEYWLDLYSALGERVEERRQRAVLAVEAELNMLARRFEHLDGIKLEYRNGWPSDAGPLRVCCEKSIREFLHRGYPFFGPHRSDFEITVSGQPARAFLSRGQQKIVALLLEISSELARQRSISDPAVFLVDDLFSELDPGNSSICLELLVETGMQILLTSVERVVRWEKSAESVGPTLFHVEHGSFSPL